MTKKLQIGSEIFNYPEQGTSSGHGEQATEWAEAVTDVLADFQGPNDILLTSQTLANNTTTPTNIPGLTFNTGQVQSITVEYLLERVYDSGSTTITESGVILGNFDGTTFKIIVEAADDVDVDITVTSGGQFQYTSSNLANHISTTIKFKASTIDQ